MVKVITTAPLSLFLDINKSNFYLFGFYGISTFAGYLMPNPFLYKWTFPFQVIQFNINMQFSSIQPLDQTLSGATIPGQSGLGSDGNEDVLCIL